MLRIVTSNNSEIFRHLGAKPLQSLGVDHTVATNYASAMELLRTKRPQVAIFDVHIPGGDGYSLCRELKAEPDLAEVRFILVIKSVVTRDEIEALNACGCDDVMALPIRSDAFFHHIVNVADLPHRRNERIVVDLRARLTHDGRTIEGTVDNVSLGGIGVTIEEELPQGELVGVRLRKGDTEYPEARTTVAWARRVGDTVTAGLSFAEVPVETRLFIEELCLFDLRIAEDGSVIVELHGDINETSDLSRLIARLKDVNDVEFNMREVRYISSAGIRQWCNFLAEMKGKSYRFRHASMAFVSQVSMVPLACGDGEILSFEAPYHCEPCERDDLRLLDSKAVHREGDKVTPPRLSCPSCGGELIFDDVPWRYFAFMRR